VRSGGAANDGAEGSAALRPLSALVAHDGTECRTTYPATDGTSKNSRGVARGSVRSRGTFRRRLAMHRRGQAATDVNEQWLPERRDRIPFTHEDSICRARHATRKYGPSGAHPVT